jgi:hypothetical protein
MSTLALDPRAGTRTPLLVLARARESGWCIDPYRVSRGVLRSVEHTLTGPLAPLEPEGSLS